MLRLVEDLAHGDAQQGDQHRQQQIRPQVVQGQDCGGIQGQTLGVDTHPGGHGAGGEGRQIAGQQCRREDGAHALELHAEEGGGQGRAEEAREDGTHARHDQHPAVVPLQAEQLAQAGCHTAAQLQSRALTPGGAAEEVGQHGRAEDAGGDLGLELLAVQNGIDNLVGAPVFLQLQQTVPADAQQTADGQQQHQPGVLQTQVGDKMEGVVEDGTQKAADGAHQHTQHRPLAEPGQIFFGMMDLVKPCHDEVPLYF